MGKTGKWLRSFLTGKKEKEKEKEKDEKGKEHDKGGTEPAPLPVKNQSAPITVPGPKEKKRWSFRRSVASGKELNTANLSVSAPAATNGLSDADLEQKRHAMAVAVATAAAADAAVAAAQAAAAVVRLTATSNGGGMSKAIGEAAAIKIQAYFRAYLARTALCALKGLVKLQALIRGHLVRMQATDILRRMQALVTAQARARVQRLQMAGEAQSTAQQLPNNRRSPQHPRSQQSYEMENNAEENIKIVEMDRGEPRSNSKSGNSYSIPQYDRIDRRHSVYYYGTQTPSKANLQQQYSPSPSALTDISPKACSGHFEEFSFATAQSSPQYFSAMSMPDASHGSIDYPFFPNYMANTESSKAKARRSQSAPRQRLDSYERQSSRRRPSVEGRNIPRGVKMQRSSSQVGLTATGYPFPWHLKLDRTNVSLKDSECGSTSTVLTNTNYCRSLAAYEVYGNKY